MTFLQLTQGRLEATSIGHQADEEAHVAALAAVRRQLIDVLELPLLPLEWTPIDHGHALTALDPTGQVVTVEVLRELGPAGLLAALARQHQAGGTARAELAARYPGGAAAFSQDWNEFREALPVHLEAGPSLVLLTCAVSPEVHASASLLRGSGVEMSLIDVRELEEASGTRLLVGIERVRSDGVTGGGPLLVARAPRRRLPAASTPTPAGQVLAESGEDSTRIVPVQPLAHAAQPDAGPVADPRRAALLASAPTTPSGPTAPSAPSPQEPGEHAGPGAGVTHRSSAPVLGAQPTVAAGQASAHALAAVASVVATPAPLVWRSLRRGIKHEAVLEAEGRIRLADGRVFTDPSLAANTVQHTQDVDGWRVWRVGQGGPSLGSLLAAGAPQD